MTPKQLSTLESYQRALGTMTSQEALEIAIQAEQFAKDCGVSDIAYPRFAHEAKVFLDYAELLELQEQQDIV